MLWDIRVKIDFFLQKMNWNYFQTFIYCLALFKLYFVNFSLKMFILKLFSLIKFLFTNILHDFDEIKHFP